jgi:hypothetical protein
MERSGTPDSPVFCGETAKNAQKTTKKVNTTTRRFQIKGLRRASRRNRLK